MADLKGRLPLRVRGNLEELCNTIDYLLMGMQHPPDEETLCSHLETELRKCQDLAADMVVFDSPGEDSPARASAFLMDAARRAVSRALMKQAKADLMNDGATCGTGKGKTGPCNTGGQGGGTGHNNDHDTDPATK